MWSFKKNLSSETNNKSKIFTVLHAATYKLLGARPLIYETSNEFVKGLKTLVCSKSVYPK